MVTLAKINQRYWHHRWTIPSSEFYWSQRSGDKPCMHIYTVVKRT